MRSCTTETGRLAPQLSERPLSANEIFWLETIRVASSDSDPAPTLATTQALRKIFWKKASYG
jgi:hypothetical protein